MISFNFLKSAFLAKTYFLWKPIWENKEPGFFKVKNGFLFLEPNRGLPTFLRRMDAWEPEVIDELNKRIRIGETVLDLGSNCGEFALQLANLVGDRGKVIGVEMDFKYYLILELTKKFNSRIANRLGFVNAKLSEEVSLNTILNEERPTFYFCDIEGDEKFLFAQLFSNKELMDQKPRLLVEFHPEFYGEKTKDDLLNMALANGFEFKKVGVKHYYFQLRNLK